jgi:hypothetical protein
MISTRLLIVPLSAALLSACIVAPYPRGPVYSQQVPAYPRSAPGYEGEYDVAVAPPAPYVEIVPAIPFAGAIWLGGYWGWNGGRHQWVQGRWDQPRAGYGWQPRAWVQQGGRWHLHGGWHRR